MSTPIAHLSPRPRAAGATVPGTLLVASSLLAVFVMAHHPSTSSHSRDAALVEMAQKAPLAKIVHGGLIALMAVQAFALLELSTHLGWHRPAVRAAVLAYVAGSLAMVGAALISGFLLPNLALRFEGAIGDAAEPLRYVVGASSLANRSLATFGALAMATGIVLWSSVLARRTLVAKIVAALGFLVGIVPGVALLLGVLRLEVPGMTLVVVAQATWNVAVGFCLARDKLSPVARPDH
jgi:hypothetical protein